MKKRGEDSIKNKSVHNTFIVTIIIFLLAILFFKSVPKIFVSSANGLTSVFNPFTSKKDNELFTKEIEKINILHKDKNLTNQNKIDKTIIAKSYVVYDVRNDKILLSKNENEALPLASLTKIITAATAVNLKNRNTIITIDSSKMRQTDTNDEKLDFGLKEGQDWKMVDLLKYGLTISSNSSMDIIAGTIYKNNSDFVAKMNDYVKSLGFKTLHFNSASGLDYGDIIGGQGSALEYAKFFSKAYEMIPDIMSYTTNSKINVESTDETLFAVPNTNEGASKSIGLLASKTGFTDTAGGNLSIMVDFDVNRPVVIVVLGSTTEGRFQDVDKLYKITENLIN